MVKLRGFFAGLLKRHIWMLGCVVFIAAFHLLKGCRPVMNAVAMGTLWVKQLLALIFSVLPVSMMEMLIIAAVVCTVVYIIFAIRDVARSSERGKTAYRRVSFAVAAVLTIYSALCVFLGASYYADSFQQKSGLYAPKTSVEELYKVTEYFAKRLDGLADQVERDENGVFAEDMAYIFDCSTEIYDGVSGEYSFLGQTPVKPKPMIFSRVMSFFNYTGIYFPFTGEANINIDQPSMLMPSTIAHELAHQRGIASEQEANFVAVLTCAKSGKAVYDYSGSLMAFIHLGNALYKYDKEAYATLWNSLPEGAKADMRANNAYWARYENKAAEASEKVYDSFLKSYGQELGVQSYGACVDLLIAYYNEYGGF